MTLSDSTTLWFWAFWGLVVFSGLALFALWLIGRRRLNRAKNEIEHWMGQSADSSEKLLAETEKRARLEAETEGLQEEVKKTRQLFESATTQLNHSFKSLAADALKGNTQQFLELAQSVLSKESGLARADLDQKRQSIEDVLQPIRKTLENYNQKLSELEKSRASSFSLIESEVRKVAESNLNLAKQTQSLKNALKKPHIRGRWGEVQLKNCVELAGMSEFCDVTFQDVNILEEGQVLIPDMTVRMPGGRCVVVDAKTPIEAFMSSLESETEEKRHLEVLRHGRHVKGHVKKLSTKAYNQAIESAADFTIMFLPNESFLYAALESEPDLVEYAIQKKVLIATPPTLIGLLKVIRFGWSEERLAENSARISEAGQELHKRLCDFVDAYANVGKHLDKARSEYDVGMKRLESRVLVQARKFEALGVQSHKSLPEGPAEATH